MTEYTFENLNSYSYKSALTHGSVFVDAFRNDYFFTTMVPKYFGPNATCKEIEREDYLARLGRFIGRSALLDLLSGKSYLCNAVEGDEVMATCLMEYPTNKRPKLTLLQNFRYIFYRIYCYVANFLDGNPKKSFLTPRVCTFFDDMNKNAGALQEKEYYDKLSEMSYDQLSDALYPMDKTVYCHVLGSRREAQGKGYGPKLLLHSISMFDETIQIFDGPNGQAQGPAKASLFPTKNNDTFYKKLGFNVVAQADVELAKGVDFTHKFMQKVISPL